MKCVATMATGILVIGFLSLGCGKQARADESSTNAVVLQSFEAEVSAPVSFDKIPAIGTKAKCLVMNHEFVVSEGTQSAVYKGKTYVFCCPGCKPKFEANPEKYIK